MSHETKHLLGVDFLNADLHDAAALVVELSQKEQKTHVVTPNPEIFLHMWESEEVHEIVCGADLNVADGFGLQWASWFVGVAKKWPMWKRKLLVYPSMAWCAIKRPKGMIKRVTGTCLMEKLLVWHQDIPYFLLGAAPGVAEEVVKKFPYANIVGTYAGNPASQFDEDIIERINQTDAQILFVAYGAPRQKKWIKRNLCKLKKVKVAIGVGGAFDYLAGHVGRAPLLFRKLGIEWLYRLIKQPHRIKRIWNAVVVFPWKVASKAYRALQE